MREHRVIRFETGRREHFWKGNVVAIGNSHGSVEPLESTAPQMIILEINQLVLNFPRSKRDRASRGIVNATTCAGSSRSTTASTRSSRRRKAVSGKRRYLGDGRVGRACWPLAVGRELLPSLNTEH